MTPESFIQRLIEDVDHPYTIRHECEINLYHEVVINPTQSNERFIERRPLVRQLIRQFTLQMKIKGYLCHLPYILDDMEQFLSFLIPNNCYYCFLCFETDFDDVEEAQDYQYRPYVIDFFQY